jgi:hypothetical protein
MACVPGSGRAGAPETDSGSVHRRASPLFPALKILASPWHSPVRWRIRTYGIGHTVSAALFAPRMVLESPQGNPYIRVHQVTNPNIGGRVR